MVPVHEVHRRIDAILPVVDANYRPRAIAESLVTIDTVIATHLKTVSDPESASVVIRGVCERRALLGVTGSTDPVQLSRQSRPNETSTSSLKRGLALVSSAAQSALDRAASVGHSYACSSGFPSESEASTTSASSVETGWTTY
jgi:hypothetical protein